ncbi:MAG TPA: PASTA domain-containing protein [Terriglobales bacterium]|nr:PASTA domain-containing protein [Terriglobales bacterium]
MVRVRGFLKVVSTALLLLSVALVSALLTMRLAVHGREVEVPDVRGKTPSEARHVAEGLSLATEIDRQYYSASVPEGRVLSQTPAPGTVVRRGGELRLAVSVGPQRVAIPQVVGESQRAASIILQQRGLDSTTSELRVSGVIAGQVLAQDPPANGRDVAAPKVSLLVAKDSPAAYLMPSFVGRPLGSVALEIKNAGFVLGKVIPAAQILNPPPAMASADSAGGGPNPTSPAPGSREANSPQNVVAATSPPQAGAPSPAALVMSQQPLAGQKIVAGAEIRLVVR